MIQEPREDRRAENPPPDATPQSAGPKAKLCKTCDGPMDGLHHRAVYCSPQCKGPREHIPKGVQRERRAALEALRLAPPPCEYCGDPIPPHRLPALYCSDRHRTLAFQEKNYERVKAERRDKRAAARTVTHRDCAYCGTRYETVAWNQRFCSHLCAHRGWRQKNPERYEELSAASAARRHEEWLARRDARPACPVCEAPLPDHRGPKAIFCSADCNNKAFYARHPEVMKERNRVRWQRNRTYWTPKMRERMAERRRTDPEFALLQNARARLHYQRNREQIRIKERERTKKNPGRSSHHAAAYRARRLGAASFTFTDKDWERLMSRFRFCCAYCGVNPGRNNQNRSRLHKEHVIPLSRGGSHSLGNILPACPQCNIAKGNRTVMEWRIADLRFLHSLRLLGT